MVTVQEDRVNPAGVVLGTEFDVGAQAKAVTVGGGGGVIVIVTLAVVWALAENDTKIPITKPIILFLMGHQFETKLCRYWLRTRFRQQS
jgi:hypothetical protein